MRAGRRILFVGRQFYPCIGGTENTMLEFARRLIADKNEVRVLTLNRDLYRRTVLPPDEEFEKIRIIRLPFIGTKRKPVPRGRFFDILDQFRWADIVHIHDVRFLMETSRILGWILRKPVVVSSSGLIFATPNLLRFKKIYFRLYLSKLIALMDRVIAVCWHDHSFLEAVVPEKKLELIEVGVDSGPYGRIVKRISRGKLVYVGRIDENKGVDLLLTALARCRAPFKLHLIYGSAMENLETELKALAKTLRIDDKIEWLGSLSQEAVYRHLSDAMYSVFPSRYEPFGITRLEAMASGTPVIANDLPSVRASMTDGEDGFIINFLSAEEAARSLEMALELPTEDVAKLGEHAKQVAYRSDWKFSYEKLTALYDRCLVETPA